MPFSTCMVALLVCLAIPSTSYAQREATGVVTFRKIEEVIQKWTPENQLFVRGELGIGPRQLTELASWLRSAGPHWTVVLMEHAEDQTYSSPDGRSYRGLDAVEAALGLGLNNRTSFGTLTHPITKESDGAVFVLFLRERKFGYYASDAQDARNLGEAHWVGELDQPAFRAMRNGGRILDAVKDTVQTINNRLTKSISAEQLAKLRVEEQRQRELVQVQTKLADLKQALAQIEASGQNFLKENPQATGALARPPVAQWNAKVSDWEGTLSSDTIASVEQQVAQLNAEVIAFENAYAAQAGFRQHFESATAQAHNFSGSGNSVIKQLGTQLKSEIDEADKLLSAGDPNFTQWLAKVDETLQQAKQAVELDRQQAEQARQRRAIVRGTIITMLWIAGAIIALILWWSNRRRRGTMQKALQEWNDRHASVTKETDQLDKLFQRNDDVLGSRERIDERGYVGATRELALKALNYVDDLFIMSKEVKRVLSQAQRLIHPRDPLGQTLNLFSSGRYQDAINQITGSPLKFQRSTGIPLIIRDMGIGKTTAQPNDGEPDEVQLSFTEIFTAFQQRGVEAQQALSTLEYCLANVQDLLTQGQQQLEQAATQEKQLDQQAAADGLFDVPAYFSALIPAIQRNLKQADDLAAFDAVQSVQGPLAMAQRQLTEGMDLGRQLQQAREKLIPNLKSNMESLKQLGYASTWIGQTLQTITHQANDLYKQASEQSIGQGNQALVASLNELDERSRRVIALAKDIAENKLPTREQLAADIDETRRDLAGSLKLTIQQVLHELDRDPDDWLARARNSIEAAKSMLLEGRVSAVEEALATFDSAVHQAQQILAQSKEAVKNYRNRSEQLAGELKKGQTRVPDLVDGINAAERNYAASALLVAPAAELVGGPIVMAQVVSSSTSTPPSTQPMLTARPADWHLSEAEEGHTEIARLLRVASEHHSAGQVLAAAAELDQATALLQITQTHLTQIADHLQLLEHQSESNVAQQQRNEAELESLQLSKRNPLVTNATLSAITQTQGLVDSNRQLVVTRTAAPNPFETAQALLKTQRQMEQLKAQVMGDEQAHAEARRAVQGARQQLAQANQLVRQSQTDGIPDSAQIIQTNSRVSQQSEHLNQLERELEVPHGDWRQVDQQAARLQSELAASAQALTSELSAAGQALAAFQQASQIVLQAGQWAGPWGLRVSGTPGVRELERARNSLQSGNYDIVLQVSQLALMAAQTAIQQAEREVARRQLEEQRQREAERRARDASRRSDHSFDTSVFSSGSSHSSSSHSSSSHSSSSHSSSSSSSSNSGFSRSGW